MFRCFSSYIIQANHFSNDQIKKNETAGENDVRRSKKNKTINNDLIKRSISNILSSLALPQINLLTPEQGQGLQNEVQKWKKMRIKIESRNKWPIAIFSYLNKALLVHYLLISSEAQAESTRLGTLEKLYLKSQRSQLQNKTKQNYSSELFTRKDSFLSLGINNLYYWLVINYI